MATMVCASRKTATIILTIAIVFFVSCAIILACFPLLYRTLLYKQIILVNNSMLFEMWRDLPIPIYESVYYFNITNAKEFLEKKEKLNVVQVGPYVFDVNWKKHHIQWHPNKTITYQEMRKYNFLPNKSVGSMDDEIVTFNGPMIMAAKIVRDKSMFLKAAASLLFLWKKEEIIIKRSIRELTYEGYYDPIIDYGKYILSGLPFKDGKFAWLAGKNATYDGQFTVFTGEDDIKKVNIINNWNGRDKLTFWENDTCNMMNGSSIETNPPLEDGQRELSFYQSFFCRTLTFTYNDVDVSHKGIPAKRFFATDKIFANRTDNPDNYCFDTQPNLRSGLQDVGPCQFGAPAFLSFPHFFLADPYYEKAVTGLNSSDADYSSYVDIQPETGLSIEAKLNFQLNLQLQADPEILQFMDVPEGFFPVLWIQLHVGLPDDLADMVYSKLFLSKTIIYSVLGVVLVVSLVVILVSVVNIIKQKGGHRPCVTSDVDSTLCSPGESSPSLSNSGPPPRQPYHESQEQSKPTGFKSVEKIEKEKELSKSIQEKKALAYNPSFHGEDEPLVQA